MELGGVSVSVGKDLSNVPNNSLMLNKGVQDAKYRYNTLSDLIKVVRSYASSDELNRQKVKTMEKIKITLPNDTSLIVKGSDLNIVDLPGIENYYYADKI